MKRCNTCTFFVLSILFMFSMASCKKEKREDPVIKENRKTDTQLSLEGKRILYINSYHKGNTWSDGIERGVVETLDKSGVELKIIYMDTKRNPSEKFKQDAAKQAVRIIDEFDPHVVITSDDNAAKYVIKPYYLNKKRHFVFCGINWDASVYGFPTEYITGMVEVTPVQLIMNPLLKYTRGPRVGLLVTDTLSEHRHKEHFEKVLDITFNQVRFIKTYGELKKSYREMQGTNDALLLGTYEHLAGFDLAEFTEFAYNELRIPTGSEALIAAEYSVLVYSVSPMEHGRFAANRALEIIRGEDFSHPPVIHNQEGDLYLNLTFADKLDIIFEPELIQNATRVFK